MLALLAKHAEAEGGNLRRAPLCAAPSCGGVDQNSEKHDNALDIGVYVHYCNVQCPGRAWIPCNNQWCDYKSSVVAMNFLPCCCKISIDFLTKATIT